MDLLNTPYISSTPIKLGKNTPEMIKYAFNDISTSEQGIMIITLATWMQIRDKHCQILYNQDNMVNLKKLLGKQRVSKSMKDKIKITERKFLQVQ